MKNIIVKKSVSVPLVILRSESTAQQKEKRPDQQPCSNVTEISLAWTLYV